MSFLCTFPGASSSRFGLCLWRGVVPFTVFHSRRPCCQLFVPWKRKHLVSSCQTNHSNNPARIASADRHWHRFLGTWAEGVLAIAAGLLLCLLLEGASRRVSQAEAHAVLLGRSWSWPSRRNKHGGAILEGSSTRYGTGHSRVVRQACVTVAWRQKGLLTAVVLWLALGLRLGLRRLRLRLVLSLALSLGRLRRRKACGGSWGGGVIPAKLCDFT